MFNSNFRLRDTVSHGASLMVNGEHYNVKAFPKSPTMKYRCIIGGPMWEIVIFAPTPSALRRLRNEFRQQIDDDFEAPLPPSGYELTVSFQGIGKPTYGLFEGVKLV